MSEKNDWFWDSEIRVLKFTVPGKSDSVYMFVPKRAIALEKRKMERRCAAKKIAILAEEIRIEEIESDTLLVQQILATVFYPVYVSIQKAAPKPPGLKTGLRRFAFSLDDHTLGLKHLFEQKKLPIEIVDVCNLFDPNEIFIRQSVKINGIRFSFFTNVGRLEPDEARVPLILN